MSRFLTLQRAATASPVAIAALVAANAVPLLGVLLLGWDLATLVAIYWAENGVVGMYAVGRILTAGNEGPRAIATTGPAAGVGAGNGGDGDGAAQNGAAAPPPSARYGAVAPSARYGAVAPPGPPPPGPPPAPLPASPSGAVTPILSPAAAKVFMVPFFCVHYGMFWVVHGIFVWTALPMMFSAAAGGGMAGPDGRVVLFAALVMLVSHGISFIVNWLLGGEYRTSSAAAEMGAPYARVVILHLTIIFGAFAVAIIGAQIGALVVMVVLKTIVDLAAHLGERARAAKRASEAAFAAAA